MQKFILLLIVCCFSLIACEEIEGDKVKDKTAILAKIESVKNRMIQYTESQKPALEKQLEEVIKSPIPSNMAFLDIEFDYGDETGKYVLSVVGMDNQYSDVADFATIKFPDIYIVDQELKKELIALYDETEWKEPVWGEPEREEPEREEPDLSLSLERAEYDVVVSLISSCWENVNGDQYPLPAFVGKHDSLSTYDLKKKKWVDIELKADPDDEE